MKELFEWLVKYYTWYKGNCLRNASLVFFFLLFNAWLTNYSGHYRTVHQPCHTPNSVVMHVTHIMNQVVDPSDWTSVFTALGVLAHWATPTPLVSCLSLMWVSLLFKYIKGKGNKYLIGMSEWIFIWKCSGLNNF